MAGLTARQIREIKRIISEHTELLMELTVGGGKVSPELVKKLKLPKEIKDMITTGYKYGKLGVIQGKDLSKMTVDEVDKLIKQVKITTRQQKSIEYLKAQTQLTIDSLTQRITNGVLSAALQSQISMYEAVKQVVPSAIENNTDRYKVAQQLRDMTNDWERDWHRVVHTEMWNAKVQGEANAIVDNESPLSQKGKDTLVFKRPAHNACNKCKQLYLERDGITPKVFKLSEMQAFGTNYGLKQADWKPVVGTVHPNCMCVLSVMPDGYHFDKFGQLEMDD